MSLDPLSGRVLSVYPLSVGTSLAFESIYPTTQSSIDPDRKIQQIVNFNDYQEFFINLSTLFRNMIGSLSKEEAARVNSYQLKDSLITEMETIESINKNEGSNKLKIIFYVCEYKKLQTKENNFVKLRKDDTTNQKIYRELHNQTIKLLLNQLHQSDTLRVYDSEINVRTKNTLPDTVIEKTNALILTHIAYDLVSYKNFKLLDLIESHSGVLKKRQMWYGKYYNGKELFMIPFLEGFLSVFGDSTYFKPMDIRLRKEIIEIAKLNNWTQVTTLAKIKSNIESIKNKYYVDILKSIL